MRVAKASRTTYAKPTSEWLAYMWRKHPELVMPDFVAQFAPEGGYPEGAVAAVRSLDALKKMLPGKRVGRGPDPVAW